MKPKDARWKIRVAYEKWPPADNWDEFWQEVLKVLRDFESDLIRTNEEYEIHAIRKIIVELQRQHSWYEGDKGKDKAVEKLIESLKSKLDKYENTRGNSTKN